MPAAAARELRHGASAGTVHYNLLKVTVSAGSRLEPYQIVAPIGAGGMGEVYRATGTRLNRAVAIKVLPQQLPAS